LISRQKRAYHHYLLIHFHFSFFLYPFRFIVRVRYTNAYTNATPKQIYAGD